MADRIQTSSMYLHAYLDRAGRRAAALAMVQVIEEQQIRCDTIAVRGVSGALLGPMVADLLGKELIVVRKRGEIAHASGVEGYLEVKNYIVVDDLVASGATVRAIRWEIEQWALRQIERGSRQEEELPVFDGVVIAECGGMFYVPDSVYFNMEGFVPGRDQVSIAAS